MNDISASEVLSQGLLKWRRARRSFDARSLKERRLIIIAVMAVAWLAADTLWITPGYKALSAARKEFAVARGELLALQRQQAVHTAEMLKATATVRTDLAAVRQRLQNNSEAFSQAERVLVPAREMRQLLEGLLAEQQRLRLVSMKTMPRQSVQVPNAAASAPGEQLYRHGLEITVSGGFHDLLNWLLSIEELPRKVLWQTLELRADDQARLFLTVGVQTLSRDTAPLEMSP